MECLDAGTLQLDRLNHASVVLIPISNIAKEVGDYRPISVLNASVKIISKVLTNRLREVLGDIIDDNQTTFLKDWSILKSIAARQEVIQFPKRNKVPGCILNLDFEKAYDTVKWNCTLEVLQSWRFSCLWITWITLWLRSTKVAIMVNGTRAKEIACKKGLRQGDSLSLIFVLIVDGLNHMIAKCRKGVLKRLGCRDKANAVINL